MGKTWIKILRKKIYIWSISTWTDGFNIMEKCIIGKCKSEPQWHTTSSIGRAIIKNKNNNCWWGCGKTGILMHWWQECKMVQLLRKIVWQFLRKLNIAISFVGIHPKELKASTWTDICTPTYTVALLAIVKMWKQSSCPLMKG